MNMNIERIHIRNIHEYLNNSYNESAYITLQPSTTCNLCLAALVTAAPS